MKHQVISLSVLFSIYITTIVMAQSNDAFPVRVTIEHGTIEGDYSTKSGVQSYLGIPFAKPPVVELRWKATQPPEKWTGVKETKNILLKPGIPTILIYRSGHQLLLMIKTFR